MQRSESTALMPDWIDPAAWASRVRTANESDVRGVLTAGAPGEDDFATLLSPAAGALLEELAWHARERTRTHFGRTISLYVPLYLSDYCPGGCLYCGFASDRHQKRHRLERADQIREFDAIREMGFDEILLLTGERTPQADYAYLRDAVTGAAERFAAVTIEAFPMTTNEYRGLSEAGCVGVTLYQETYDTAQYERLHRWGPKRDYAARLEAPSRVLEAGIRSVGLGVLLGLSDPVSDALSLYRHARMLRKRFWQGGVGISFPRVCPQEGGFVPPFPVSDRFLAQIIFAFRLCMPDVPLTLSTRERAAFRDGMAGVGITKMSIASRTTVGGYQAHVDSPDGQFHVSDDRDVPTFCAALRAKGLEPVFKNWDRVYRG
jgi:2-iminoacetate synthase